MDRVEERLLIAILTSLRLSSASVMKISEVVSLIVCPSSIKRELPDKMGGSLTASKVTS